MLLLLLLLLVVFFFHFKCNMMFIYRLVLDLLAIDMPIVTSSTEKVMIQNI